MLKLTMLHVTSKEVIIEDVQRELTESLDLFEKSHQDILDGTFRKDHQYDISPELKAFYIQTGLDRDVIKFISLVRQSLAFDEISPELTRQFRENLLEKLDQAVNLVERESSELTTRFSYMEIVILFLTLLTLLLEVKFIFSPLETTLHKVIDELVQSKEKAIEAGLAKSQFLAMVSHEIRTPLNGILGTTQLLLEEKIEPEVREHLDVIRVSGEHLKSLINDTLELVKMESGKMNIENEVFNIMKAFTTTISLFEANAKTKGLNLIFLEKGIGNIEWVLGGVTRIKQVLANLLSNAIKFTPSGTITISPSYQVLDNGDYLFTVHVRDTGVGISEAKKDQLFEMFEQGDNATNRKFGGTGLGLTISRGLCRGMGGDVWAKNNSDRGATFSFSFKVSRAKTPENNSEATQNSSDPEFAKKHPLSVLVVDDNEINRTLGVSFLAKLGYKAMMADGGLQALEMQKQHNFDVIFMDCQMPTYDGFYATRLIRSEGFSSEQTWIVACTASPSDQYRQESQQSGMNDFIVKPLTFESLKNSLAVAYHHVAKEKTNG